MKKTVLQDRHLKKTVLHDRPMKQSVLQDLHINKKKTVLQQIERAHV